MYKILAFSVFALAACQHTSKADLDEAQAASDDFCTCINIPATEYGPCSKAKYPRWTAIHDKLASHRNQLDEAARATLTQLEGATVKCKAIGDEVWRYVNVPKPAPTAAPAPTAPSPSAAPTPEK